jgi:hypothetical protein
MGKVFELSLGMIKGTEITFESMEDLPALTKGLQFIVLEYFAENLDTGVDGQIDGAFLRDFSELIQYLFSMEEELKKA